MANSSEVDLTLLAAVGALGSMAPVLSQKCFIVRKIKYSQFFFFCSKKKKTDKLKKKQVNQRRVIDGKSLF